MVLAATLSTIVEAQTNAPPCPIRPAGCSFVRNPVDVLSENGVLNVAFTLRSEQLFYLEECFIYQGGNGPIEAPTLRLHPGDKLILSLTNRLSYVPPPQLQRRLKSMPSAATARMRTHRAGG